MADPELEADIDALVGLLPNRNVSSRHYRSPVRQLAGRWLGSFLHSAASFGPTFMDLVLDAPTIEGTIAQVVGAGVDPVADFTLSGTIDTGSGAVALVKRYATHDVEYRGLFEPAGIVRGVWSTGGLGSGVFALCHEETLQAGDAERVARRARSSRGLYASSIWLALATTPLRLPWIIRHELVLRRVRSALAHHALLRT